MQSKNPTKISNSGPVSQIQSRQHTSGDNDSGNLGTAKTQHSPYNANRNSKAPLQTLASRQNKVNTIDYVSSNVSKVALQMVLIFLLCLYSRCNNSRRQLPKRATSTCIANHAPRKTPAFMVAPAPLTTDSLSICRQLHIPTCLTETPWMAGRQVSRVRQGASRLSMISCKVNY